jgi:hypothetical protein
LLTRQFGQVPLDFAPDAAYGNTKHTLAASNKVNDFVGAAALIDARTVAHDRDFGQVVTFAVVQMLNRRANVLERNTSINESLHDPKDQDVSKAV